MRKQKMSWGFSLLRLSKFSRVKLGRDLCWNHLLKLKMERLVMKTSQDGGLLLQKDLLPEAMAMLTSWKKLQPTRGRRIWKSHPHSKVNPSLLWIKIFLLTRWVKWIWWLGGDDNQKKLTIDEMIEVEKERCLVFANNNPEIVLPDNLEFDPSDLVSTPNGMPPLEPVGTADASRVTPMVLTKLKPCGLSRPFKIN